MNKHDNNGTQINRPWRMLAIIVAAMLLLALTACASNNTSTTTTAVVTAAPTETTPATTEAATETTPATTQAETAAETDAPTNDEVINIGILQLVQHGSLDAARIGFIEKLEEEGYVDGDNIKINYMNASGDQANLTSMSERLIRENDLVFAIATPAAQTLVNMEPSIPILFAAVTDPVDAGLVESLENPGREVTGASDLAPIDLQVKLLLSLAPMEKVGLLYNAGEPNSVVQIELAKQTLEEAGVEVVEMTAASTNDVAQATQNLVARVDGIFVPTDNTMATAAVTIGEICKEAKIPLVESSIEQVQAGGTATLGINYKNNGEIAGAMAAEILRGKAASSIPVSIDSETELVINDDVAIAIGLDPTTIEMPTK